LNVLEKSFHSEIPPGLPWTQSTIKSADSSEWHHTIGRFIRNNWGLWDGGALRDWFKLKGIQHADDMSNILLESLKRKLNNQPIDLDGQIKIYRDFWISEGLNPDKLWEE
jgi:hypothetical protein